jgi:acetyl esterase/lipase
LITTILLRERSSTGAISAKRFYLRRVLRIFPAYYAILALYVVLLIVFERDSAEGDQFWRNLPYFLTYTSNWFVPSPLYGNLAGLPPIRVHVGGDEMLLGDSRQYVERAVAAGVDAATDCCSWGLTAQLELHGNFRICTLGGSQ